MKLSLSVLLLLLPTLAGASGDPKTESAGITYLPDGVLTYGVFETAVEHADLDGCPAEFDEDAVFCRLTLSADQAHIFVFSYAGDSPLLAVKAYELGDGFLPF